MALSDLLSRVDWDPVCFSPVETWFLGTYLVALIQEQGLRRPEDASALVSTAERAEEFRRSVPDAYHGYPDWFGNNQEVHRPHRLRLMAADAEYKSNAVMDYRAVRVSWAEEAENPY